MKAKMSEVNTTITGLTLEGGEDMNRKDLAALVILGALVLSTDPRCGRGCRTLLGHIIRHGPRGIPAG